MGAASKTPGRGAVLLAADQNGQRTLQHVESHTQRRRSNAIVTGAKPAGHVSGSRPSALLPSRIYRFATTKNGMNQETLPTPARPAYSRHQATTHSRPVTYRQRPAAHSLAFVRTRRRKRHPPARREHDAYVKALRRVDWNTLVDRVPRAGGPIDRCGLPDNVMRSRDRKTLSSVSIYDRTSNDCRAQRRQSGPSSKTVPEAGQLSRAAVQLPPAARYRGTAITPSSLSSVCSFSSARICS